MHASELIGKQQERQTLPTVQTKYWRGTSVMTESRRTRPRAGVVYVCTCASVYRLYHVQDSDGR